VWNRGVVVAGPADLVEMVERTAAAGRTRLIRSSEHVAQELSTQWREKPRFSLGPLLGLVAPATRGQLRPQLPREESPLVVSRLETLDGKLRLEYWFATGGSAAPIERLCRSIVAEHPLLSFVVAALNRGATEARACLIRAEGVERYRLPERRRLAHMRREARKWGSDRFGREFARMDAAKAMLAETCGRWDVALAGAAHVSVNETPYHCEPPIFGPNPTNRRLIVAGPASEVEWFIARARGRLRSPSRRGIPWRSRSQISFRALANLLPPDVRPRELPPDVERSWLDEIWGHERVARARWILTDYESDDDAALERLLVALSARYRQVCFVACSEEPDTFEAGGMFVWRGRIATRPVSRADRERIVKSVYAEYGRTPDSEDDDSDGAADDEVDGALLDHAELLWDSRVLRTLNA